MVTYASPSALKWTLLILNSLIFVIGTFMLVQGAVMFIGVDMDGANGSGESGSVSASDSSSSESASKSAAKAVDLSITDESDSEENMRRRSRDLIAALARSERKRERKPKTTEPPTTTTTTEEPSESDTSESDDNGSDSASSSSEEDGGEYIEPKFPSVGNSKTILLFAILIEIVSGIGCMAVLQENVGLCDAYGYASFISAFTKLLFIFGSVKMHANDKSFDPMDSITVVAALCISIIEMVLGMCACQYTKLLKRGDAAEPRIEPLPAKV